jgi:hypothetical protein
LKSPDSVNFGDYPHSFHLRNTWAESYARPVSVEISGLFKHPLSLNVRYHLMQRTMISWSK